MSAAGRVSAVWSGTINFLRNVRLACFIHVCDMDSLRPRGRNTRNSPKHHQKHFPWPMW